MHQCTDAGLKGLSQSIVVVSVGSGQQYDDKLFFLGTPSNSSTAASIVVLQPKVIDQDRCVIPRDGQAEGDPWIWGEGTIYSVSATDDAWI